MREGGIRSRALGSKWTCQWDGSLLSTLNSPRFNGGGSVRCVDGDVPTALAALARLEEEVAELRCAVENGVQAEIVDELVDVMYFASIIRDCSGLTQSVLTEHSEFKSCMREVGIRNKRTELRFASELVSSIPCFVTGSCNYTCP